MRKNWLIGLICFLLLFLVGCGSDELEVDKGSIQVVDGDTFKAKVDGKQETVRLRLVDTPELNTKSGSQPLSEEAKAFTEKKLREAKKITLIEDEEQGRDQHNRLLAFVFVDGKLLQDELVKNGYARIAFAERSKSEYLEDLRKSESEARNKKVGIWQWDGYVKNNGFNPEAVKPNTPQFVASSNSDVYHPIDCHVVQTIKPENRIFYYTEEEAQKDQKRRSQVKECWEAK